MSAPNRVFPMPDAEAGPILPPPDVRCRLTVTIPARNEATLIMRTLLAVADQRDLTGATLAPGTFDILVFANNCTDGTAAIVRRFAADTPHIPVFVVEERLSSERAHIGAARKHVMDLAAQRFEAARLPAGLIASTDADTVVDSQWVAWTLREAQHADAVAGHVTISRIDQESLIAPVRRLYAREVAYRQAIAELEALIDPMPADPFPRHSSFVGASFAISARCYRAAGGLPPLPRLEDLHFQSALQRIDANIRHSLRVRATTSARLDARVDGGFSSLIAHLHASAQRGTFYVEHPRQTIEQFERRAALRRRWQSTGTGTDAAKLPFGAYHERSIKALNIPVPAYPPAPVEVAIDSLRAACDRYRQMLDEVPQSLRAYPHSLRA